MDKGYVNILAQITSYATYPSKGYLKDYITHALKLVKDIGTGEDPKVWARNSVNLQR